LPCSKGAQRPYVFNNIRWNPWQPGENNTPRSTIQPCLLVDILFFHIYWLVILYVIGQSCCNILHISDWQYNKRQGISHFSFRHADCQLQLGFDKTRQPCSVLAIFINVLLVRDIARQVKSSRYVPREIACRGIRSKHTEASQSESVL
jgi:hypothetical protein